MARRPTIREILEQLIDFFSADIRSAFLASIQNVVDNVVLADVVKAIREGDLDKAFRALGFNDAAMRPLTAAIERAFEAGGVTIGGTFPKKLNTPDGRAVFRFDVRDSRAEKWLREQSSTLVTNIREDTRIAVRNVLTDGMRAGENPRIMALDIVGRVDATGARSGGIVGLTPGQERWVANTRTMLENLDAAYLTRKLRDKRFDKTVERAIRNGTPLPADTIQKLVSRYRANALKYRGDTIGRTEAISALNRSEYEAIKQAVDMGATKASNVQRVWDSADDDGRTRETHLQMEGQTVGLDEPFTFPGGSQAMFPGDTSLGAPPEETINCRCRFRLKVDWLASAVEAEPTSRPVFSAQSVPQFDRTSLDANLKRDVLAKGIAANREFLTAYDANTGKIIGNSSGSKNFVGVSDELLAAMRDPSGNVIVHHNHPQSSSFSKQDIDMITMNPGLKGLWAHGHNDSSFYVERGSKALTEKIFTDIRDDSYAKLNKLVQSRKIDPNDAGLIFNHLWMLELNNKEYLRYSFELKGKSSTIWDKYNEISD